VLLAQFPAAAFGTNCYVVAPAAGEECLVVDPGIGVVDQLAEVLAAHRLRPAAVLLTHGHIDHTYSVTPVCGAHGVAAHVHGADAYRLSDPVATLDPGLRVMLEQQYGPVRSWSEPEDVVELVDGQVLELAGLHLDVSHAPGHTEGSVMFALPGIPDPPQVPAGAGEAASTLLVGDVLFAGGVGRTDLAGGDHAAMLRSLRDRILTLPDDVLVLPGHGPGTTIGRERATNPYLQLLHHP
jgi:hydroxyacylglutathione hydrolase